MKIKPKQLKVIVPNIITFSDYHEIDTFLYDLNEFFGGKMKAKELGFDGGYQAIFYLKQDREYKALVKEWKNSHKEEYDDEG